MSRIDKRLDELVQEYKFSKSEKERFVKRLQELEEGQIKATDEAKLLDEKYREMIKKHENDSIRLTEIKNQYSAAVEKINVTISFSFTMRCFKTCWKSR